MWSPSWRTSPRFVTSVPETARALPSLRAPQISHMWPCCFLRPVPMGASFLRTCKLAAMQFVVLKPLCTLVALALESKDLYGEGELRPDR